MYFSFTGKVIFTANDYIVINLNNIGYQIFVSRAKEYSLNEEVTIYLHNVVREDEQYLVGFRSLKEKDAFLTLISVKGIGPKTALGVLSATTSEELFNAIASNNIAFLKKLPNIGNKGAQQIILDLKGQLTSYITSVNQYYEVKEALKNLGFKTKEVDDALSKISIRGATNEEILREALRKLKK